MLEVSENIEALTAEILVYKEQTARNIFEIGKRLIKVKEILPHGTWGEWLKVKVDFSEVTAQRFMRCATEFSNTSTSTYLPSSHLFELLTLPTAQREDFMLENNTENMTVKELREAIKAKKAAEKQLQEAENKYQELQEEHAHMKENVNQMIIEKLDLQNKNAMLEDDCSDYQNLWSQSKLDNESLLEEIKEQKNLITELTSQIVIAKNGNLDNGTVAELTEKLNHAHNEIKKLTAKIDTPIVVEKIVERTPDNVLSRNLLKHYEAVEYNFSQLIDTLGEVQDDSLKNKYTAAMKAWLSSARESMDKKL